MFKNILVPTDGSKLSQQAVGAAIELARGYGSKIVAFSVAEAYPMVTAAAMMIDPGTESAMLQDLAQLNVEWVAQAAKIAGVPCTTATAVSDSPYQEILAAATDHHCDVIFMASHGRRGLTKLLAGSVTQNVLAYSTIPVLVMRPKATELAVGG